jgi:hydroxymethylglutaryl-CoA reductase (NADPH)
MDLRSLPDGLTPAQRTYERRRRVEEETGVDLSLLATTDARIGAADERNCEQMLGTIALPVGYAGPLPVTFSSGERADIHLPLATTEGALVASVNRGCKALREAGGARIVKSVHHGTTRSLAFRIDPTNVLAFMGALEQMENEWKRIAESTSRHLKILSYHIASQEDHVFLTIAADTSEAMGMNMVTIAAQAVGDWIAQNFRQFGVHFVTVAGNVDSDKKPSKRTHELGRGYEVVAGAALPEAIIKDVLQGTPEELLAVARAKLDIGSTVAGALGKNLHAANIVAALYLATGQDAAHVVEGSLADTSIQQSVISNQQSLHISVRSPALLVGVRGGGTTLPAQAQCLKLLLHPKTSLPPRQQLAEAIGAAILAGEISLLAAQATHALAKAHGKYGR